MRVVLSCIGKFHHFHLARELYRRDALECVFTGYPWFKLRSEGLPQEKVRTFPWIQGFRMSCGRIGIASEPFIHELEQWSHRAHDRFVCRHLPGCDAFVGLSGAAGRSGRKARSQGALYVCDRGSSHIRFQRRMMAEEASLWNLAASGPEQVDPRSVAAEEEEYGEADFVTVPSEFTRRSFLAEGVPAEKVVKIAYGADIARFRPTGEPERDGFTVLFVGRVSLRKGALYLIEAFARLAIPRKRLLFLGTVSPAVRSLLGRFRLDNVSFLGPVSHEELSLHYSRAHVLALPSIEEGLAYVMGEAMACGCPVLATPNAGAEDLFTDGREGFIVPARDVGSLQQRLMELHGDRALRQRMSAAAIERTRAMQGWAAYGERYFDFLSAGLAGPPGGIPARA